MFVHNNLIKKANNLRKLNNSARSRLKTSGSMNSLAENQTSLLNKSVSRGEMVFYNLNILRNFHPLYFNNFADSP